MPKRGKKYQEIAKKVDRSRLYDPVEAVHLVRELSYAKFDATVEAHIRLNIDPRHADQNVRTSVVLPHGTGKPVRVLVFAEGEAARIAEEAGADFVGLDELIAKIKDGWYDFDAAVAIPQVMPKVGPLGRYLGRRGLMPNPKSGTLVQPQDLPRVIQELKRGRVEVRNDRYGIVHVPIGRVSYAPQQLLENLAAVIEALNAHRPAAVKGTYIRSVALAPSMGPSVRVDPAKAAALKVDLVPELMKEAQAASTEA